MISYGIIPTNLTYNFKDYTFGTKIISKLPLRQWSNPEDYG